MLGLAGAVYVPEVSDVVDALARLGMDRGRRGRYDAPGTAGSVVWAGAAVALRFILLLYAV